MPMPNEFKLFNYQQATNEYLNYRPWMSRVLLVASVYNVLWGLFAIGMPSKVFQWSGLELPNYPELWQCVGMIVGVYGVGYGLAANNPLRHWPIVLVGLLGKIFGPIGFVWAIINGRFNMAFGFNIVLNDLIWWIPFVLIIRAAWTEPPEKKTRE